MQRRVITQRFGQAQDLAGIDREDPITQGLFNGFLHPAASLRGDLVTGALAPSVTDRGLAFVSASSSNTAVFQGRFSPQSSAATWLVLARRDGTQPDSGFGMAVAVNQVSGTQDPFHLFIKTSGERFRVNTVTEDNTNSWETTTDWVVGQWMVGVYTWASGGTPAAYRNGVLQTLSLNSGAKSGTLKPSNTTTVNLAALRLNGAVGGFLVWDRVLTADEIRAVSLNPWRVLAKRRRFVPVGTAGVNAALSATDQSDTFAAAGSVDVSASANMGDASDELSSSASVTVTAFCSLFDANDSIIASTSVSVSASLSTTDSQDQLSSGATVSSGTTAEVLATDSADALSSAASVVVSVEFSSTDALDVFSSAATVLGELWPDPADVRAGVMYGPTGTEYTGTLVAGIAAGSFLDVTTGRRVMVSNGVAKTL